MTRETLINKYEDKDIVEIYTADGERYIHIFGCYYYNDDPEEKEKPWTSVEMCGVITKLDKFLKMNEDERSEFQADATWYMGDYDEEGVYEEAKWIKENCKEISKLTMETPDGMYVM